MYCRNCGAETDGGTCKECGTAQIQTASVFLEKEERLLAHMGRGYLSNLLLGGTLRTDYLILSDRRIYYSGSYVGPTGISKLAKGVGNVVIPLEKVSSIAYVSASNLGLLILGCLLLPVGIGLLLLLIWAFTRERVFLVSSNSMRLAIPYRLYGQAAIHEFSRALGEALTQHRSQVT